MRKTMDGCIFLARGTIVESPSLRFNGGGRSNNGFEGRGRLGRKERSWFCVLRAVVETKFVPSPVDGETGGQAGRGSKRDEEKERGRGRDLNRESFKIDDFSFYFSFLVVLLAKD